MKLNQKKLFLYEMIETFGVIVFCIGMAAAFFSESIIVGLILGVGLVIGIIGAGLKDKLYVCPHCGHRLKERPARHRIHRKIYEHCPGCGWRVIIEE